MTLAPLVDTLPCIGAMTMTLLGEPYIDLSLRFLGCLDLMQLPGIKEAVHVIANKVSVGSTYTIMILSAYLSHVLLCIGMGCAHVIGSHHSDTHSFLWLAGSLVHAADF